MYWNFTIIYEKCHRRIKCIVTVGSTYRPIILCKKLDISEIYGASVNVSDLHLISVLAIHMQSSSVHRE
jgi:hypothetical protein